LKPPQHHNSDQRATSHGLNTTLHSTCSTDLEWVRIRR